MLLVPHVPQKTGYRTTHGKFSSLSFVCYHGTQTIFIMSHQTLIHGSIDGLAVPCYVFAPHAEAPVALVLYNAGPLNISWAKSNPSVQAILLSYFPAQVWFSAYSLVHAPSHYFCHIKLPFMQYTCLPCVVYSSLAC